MSNVFQKHRYNKFFIFEMVDNDKHSAVNNFYQMSTDTALQSPSLLQLSYSTSAP